LSAFESAAVEDVHGKRPSVFDGRRHEDVTVRNIRAEVDRSISIVGRCKTANVEMYTFV